MKKKSVLTESIHVRLPPAIAKEAKRLAKSRYVPLSTLVRQILIKALRGKAGAME